MGEQEPWVGVGKSALGVSMVRAGESSRADRLFDDPDAQAFLDAAPGVFDTEQRIATAGSDGLASSAFAFCRHAVIRTRFFDDYLVEATATGVRQVVLCAAGLDTRAFRLPWPAGVRLYEMDLPGDQLVGCALIGVAVAPRATKLERSRGHGPLGPSPGHGGTKSQPTQAAPALDDLP